MENDDKEQELSNVILSQFELQYHLREARMKGERAGYRKGVIITFLTSIIAGIVLNKGGINIIDKAEDLIDSTVKGTKRFFKNTNTALNAKTKKIKNSSKWIK